MKKLYRKSRWLHKYLGLFLVLFLMWMSVSGIILNHPEMVKNVAIPHWLVPPAYKIKNWNRSSMMGLVYSKHRPQVLYAYGKKGVWISRDEGKSFVPMQNGLPGSLYYLKTNHLVLWEKGSHPFLLAATDGGLFKADLGGEQWEQLPVREKHEKFKKILIDGRNVLAVSESHVYRAAIGDKDLRFRKVALHREQAEPKITLVKLFFDLHDGEVFGLPGRLFTDLVGLLLFFLSFTGFYIWFNPWRWRRRHQKNAGTVSPGQVNLVRSLVKYHLQIGIYVALFFLILGGTAFFMRPPFLAAIAEGSIGPAWYPGKISENVWEEKIQNALLDTLRNRLILACSDGLWMGKADFSRPFEPVQFHVPIFVMGPTYFEMEDGDYVIGSFNGLYRYNPENDRSVNLVTGQEVTEYSNIRPGKRMVTGFFETPWGQKIIATHEQGLIPLTGTLPDDRFPVPPVLNRTYTLSLWNFMFELHNGRIFQDLIGKWYILIAPLGSFLFLLLTLTGIFDWFYIKLRRTTEQSRKGHGLNVRTLIFEFRRKE